MRRFYGFLNNLRQWTLTCQLCEDQIFLQMAHGFIFGFIIDCESSYEGMFLVVKSHSYQKPLGHLVDIKV